MSDSSPNLSSKDNSDSEGIVEDLDNPSSPVRTASLSFFPSSISLPPPPPVPSSARPLVINPPLQPLPPPSPPPSVKPPSASNRTLIPPLSGIKQTARVEVEETEEKKPTIYFDSKKLLQRLPGITISTLSQPIMKAEPDINVLLQPEPDETLTDFEARRRLTMRISEFKIGSRNISSVTAVVLGFLIMKQATHGLIYDEYIESVIKQIMRKD